MKVGAPKIDSRSFYEEVHAVVCEIPRGKVSTYGEIALILGRPQNSRMAARAMSFVKDRDEVPCHRVVNAQGRTAPGWDEQKELLLSEGVLFKDNGAVDMSRCKWNWKEDTGQL